VSDEQDDLRLPRPVQGLRNLTLQGAPQPFEATVTHRPVADGNHERDMERIKAVHAHTMDLIRTGVAIVMIAVAGVFFVCHPEVWVASASLVSAAVGAGLNHLFSSRKG
jgi:hypothetical protein